MNSRQAGQLLIEALAGLLSGAIVVAAALMLWSMTHRRWMSLQAETRGTDATLAALELVAAAIREADEVVPTPGGITLIRALHPNLPPTQRRTCTGHRSDALLTRCSFRLEQQKLVVDDHSGAPPQILLGPRYATPVSDGRWRLLSTNAPRWTEAPTDWSAIVGVELSLRVAAAARWQLRTTLRNRTPVAEDVPSCLQGQRGGALPLALLVIAALTLCAGAIVTADSEQYVAARAAALQLQAFADAEYQLRQAERPLRGRPAHVDLAAGGSPTLAETLVCTSAHGRTVVCRRQYWRLASTEDPD